MLSKQREKWMGPFWHLQSIKAYPPYKLPNNDLSRDMILNSKSTMYVDLLLSGCRTSCTHFLLQSFGGFPRKKRNTLWIKCNAAFRNISQKIFLVVGVSLSILTEVENGSSCFCRFPRGGKEYTYCTTCSEDTI